MIMKVMEIIGTVILLLLILLLCWRLPQLFDKFLQ